LENTKAREVSFLPFIPASKVTTPITQSPRNVEASTSSSTSPSDSPILSPQSPKNLPGSTSSSINLLTNPPNLPNAVHLNPLLENTKAREVSFLPFIPTSTTANNNQSPRNLFTLQSTTTTEPSTTSLKTTSTATTTASSPQSKSTNLDQLHSADATETEDPVTTQINIRYVSLNKQGLLN
jgi:hypothetical protein